MCFYFWLWGSLNICFYLWLWGAPKYVFICGCGGAIILSQFLLLPEVSTSNKNKTAFSGVVSKSAYLELAAFLFLFRGLTCTPWPCDISSR